MFNTSQQDILINDSRFGLGKIEGLTIWFSACQNNTGAYDVLVANFALKGIDLNATVM
jgi:5'(3')-deoxyribonucleotidase